MQFGRAVQYTVGIEPSQNQGFIVSIGCQRRSYSNAIDMLADLTEYFTEYDAVVKQYQKANNDCPVPPLYQTTVENPVGYGSQPEEAPMTLNRRA